MELMKRTYSLPVDTVRELEGEVDTRGRSRVIADLIQNWVEMRRREKLRQAIIEGCREMADVYLEVEAEYHPLEAEVDRRLGWFE
jgi:metal-responsive CopG/Arc/MetJ family transcriptional regulator